MIANALICYALSAIIPFASLWVLVKFGKDKIRFSLLHIIVGAVMFFVALAAVLASVVFLFSMEMVDRVTIYMPEWLYKVSVTFVVFAILCAIRYFLLNSAYFNRNREQNGTSFLVGFGIAGGVAVSLYSLYSFVYIALTAISTDFVEITKESVLVFSDSTVISVFYPFWPHIVVSVVFVVYTVLMLIQARFMTQHANLPYKWKHTFIMYILTSTCETCMLSLMLLSFAHISYIAILVMTIILVALSFVSVRLLYKYKEELPYTKQFN